MTPKITFLLGWSLAMLPVVSLSGDCEIDDKDVTRIRNERVTGSLAEAEGEARRMLECPRVAASTRIGLQIELARILDRVGLHTNTRPVLEALELLRSAETAASKLGPASRADVWLALAEYFYRAEMSDRSFETATDYALRARTAAAELEDPAVLTDAVHRLGLIEFQKRNLAEARELFDESLEISLQGPRRLIFLSDYHRHIGFVDMLSGDQATAIEHFEASLALRDDAGSIDYGLFARTMLATALIDDGRAREAQPLLEQALGFALEIPSPVGEVRALFALGKMYERLENPTEAVLSFRQAAEKAEALGLTSIQKSAVEGMSRLSSPPN